jgi:RNA-directed DNA polymerase
VSDRTSQFESGGSGESLDLWLAFIRENVSSLHQADASAYVAALLDGGFPVIFDVEHLALRVGLPVELVRAIMTKTDLFYRAFSIPKRSGGTRDIRAPYPALLMIQRWIARRVLSRIQPSDWAHGFAANRSIVTNAKEHLNGKAILRMDIKEFFPSITIARVIDVYRNINYSHEASYALAKICTLDGVLPQGGATSPALANIIARSMDARLAALADRCGLRYSRYADDVVFSGERISNGLPATVGRIIGAEGFTVNDKKTLLARDAQRVIVTGVAISGGRTRLPREKRRALRSLVHQMLSNTAGRRLPTDPQCLQRLLGSLAHWTHVEPSNEFALRAQNSLKEYRAKLLLELADRSKQSSSKP